MLSREFTIANEAEMLALGGAIAAVLRAPAIVYLDGPLGAGKTTLVRGLLNAKGHIGPVKSPTYTLVEPYSFADFECYHFDLYRLSEPEELEAMGIRDYLTDDSVCLIEWPKKGSGLLPAADLRIAIQYGAEIATQRSVSCMSTQQTVLNFEYA